MHLHSVVLAIIITFVVSTNASPVITTDTVRATHSKALQPNYPILKHTLVDGPSLSVLKRSLRVHNTEENSDGGLKAFASEDEERGIFQKVKFWWWLKRNMNPKKLHTKFGLDGLELAARDHPKFKEYLAFSSHAGLTS
ncbi:Avirulence protein (Avh) [Phytophthora palmivora]|uniref:Avirulence protein (Avh) n=1 Tax=Phytophthora palmivora TaxID=4796 RepID=A0A2P4XSK5_9STRA|nr:Avirulence protein (Avh) [Phytophthora palmivora]